MLNKWKRQGLRGRVYAKRARSFDGGSSKGRLDIKDKPRFKKRFFNLDPSKLPKSHHDKVKKPNAQKGKSGNSLNEKSTCAKCKKEHIGECLVGTGNYYGCVKCGNKVKD